MRDRLHSERQFAIRDQRLTDTGDTGRPNPVQS
jgi:hypothetical protein